MQRTPVELHAAVVDPETRRVAHRPDRDDGPQRHAPDPARPRVQVQQRRFRAAIGDVAGGRLALIARGADQARAQVQQGRLVVPPRAWRLHGVQRQAGPQSPGLEDGHAEHALDLLAQQFALECARGGGQRGDVVDHHRPACEQVAMQPGDDRDGRVLQIREMRTDAERAPFMAVAETEQIAVVLEHPAAVGPQRPTQMGDQFRHGRLGGQARQQRARAAQAFSGARMRGLARKPASVAIACAHDRRSRFPFKERIDPPRPQHTQPAAAHPRVN